MELITSKRRFQKNTCLLSWNEKTTYFTITGHLFTNFSVYFNFFALPASQICVLRFFGVVGIFLLQGRWFGLVIQSNLKVLWVWVMGKLLGKKPWFQASSKELSDSLLFSFERWGIFTTPQNISFTFLLHVKQLKTQ